MRGSKSNGRARQWWRRAGGVLIELSVAAGVALVVFALMGALGMGWFAGDEEDETVRSVDLAAGIASTTSTAHPRITSTLPAQATDTVTAPTDTVTAPLDLPSMPAPTIGRSSPLPSSPAESPAPGSPSDPFAAERADLAAREAAAAEERARQLAEQRAAELELCLHGVELERTSAESRAERARRDAREDAAVRGSIGSARQDVDRIDAELAATHARLDIDAQRCVVRFG